MGSNDNNSEEIVLTAMKTDRGSMMRMDRKSKADIDMRQVHHVAGGPYRGILVNKQAGALDSVSPPEARVEFMAYLINADQNNAALKDRWSLRFWFHTNKHTDGLTRKKTLTEYFSELISPQALPRKYVGFIKRALVLLQSYSLIRRLELEVEELNDGEEDLPPIKSFVSVFTPDNYIYRFVPEVSVADKVTLTFKLRAAACANVALCAVYGDVETKTYEVAIGAENNTMSYIRDGSMGRIMAQSHTVNILSETEFRYFWLSWADNCVMVGRGGKQGQDTFLRWSVPSGRQIKVNSLAVATSAAGKGQWEFAEIIDEQDLNRSSKKQKVQLSLLWLAKKERMLEKLEEAYPRAVSTQSLFNQCRVAQTDNITAIVQLKDLERKGLIQEVEAGVWVRMQTHDETPEHNIQLVQDITSLPTNQQPSVAIVTSMYQEKLAVDAMIEDKRTYLKCDTEDAEIYTIGCIDHHVVVTTKLAHSGDADKDLAAAENSVTKLLARFPSLKHSLMVGVGGAVPNYTEAVQHVRRGDVVVSTPGDDSGAVYVYCSRVEKIEKASGFSYITRIFAPTDQTLDAAVKKLQRQSEITFTGPRPWDEYIEAGKERLKGQESDFHRPMIKSDKLFYTKPDNSVIQVEHPRPTGFAARHVREGQTNIKYGVIACGIKVSRADPIRQDFAMMYKVKAFHQELDVVLEAFEGGNCPSFMVILGISDYVDGTKRGWRSYAALAAAAYTKSLLLSI